MNRTQTVDFGLMVIQNMEIRRLKLYLNFAACLLCAAYGYRFGASPEWVIGAIGWIQGVNLPEVIEAYHKAKWQNKTDQ